MGMRDGPLGYPLGNDTQLEGVHTHQKMQPRPLVTREPACAIAIAYIVTVTWPH